MNWVNLEVASRSSKEILLLEVVDNCPICHAKISPIHLYSCRENYIFSEQRAHIISSVFACPNCHSLFYAKSQHEENSHYDRYNLSKYGPSYPEKTDFGDEIGGVSPAFIEIYNQSEAAEAYKLNQIAGVGYRKALEFLIKDYACHIHPEQEGLIKESFLKDCINKYIDHQKIKDIATVATWLGNDETHYLRKWNEMDVQDLKRFIRSCVAWIQADIDAADSANIIASR